MRWDIIARGLLRYTLPLGGVAGLLAYELGEGIALFFLGLGVMGLALTLIGDSGTGTAAVTVEPGSGVNVTPRDYATKPIGSKNVRAFFWAIGLILGTVTGILLS